MGDFGRLHSIGLITHLGMTPLLADFSYLAWEHPLVVHVDNLTQDSPLVTNFLVHLVANLTNLSF